MTEQTDAGSLTDFRTGTAGLSVADAPGARSQTRQTSGHTTDRLASGRASASDSRALPVVTRGDIASVRTSAMVRGYRGFLPLQSRRQPSIQAQPGSLLDDFCRVYEGLCPDSRRFDLPAGPSRQFIIQSEITSERRQWLTEQYQFQSRIRAGHFQGIRDRQHRQTLTLHLGLLTSASRRYQHSVFMQTAFVNGDTQTGAPSASAKRLHIGYRQDIRLSGDLAERLAGSDYLTWELIRGRYSRDNSVTDTTRIRLSPLWQWGSGYIRLSTARARYQPPSDHVRGDYHEQIHRLETGITGTSAHAFSALFRYFHIRSAGLSYARSHGRFTHLLPWQAEQQSRKHTQISLLITGTHSVRGISPFIMLQQHSADRPAFADKSRQHIISFGVNIAF